MNRATATALAAALALGGAACDSTTRPIEPTADVDAECSRCHGNPPPPFIAGGSAHPASPECSLCHPGTVQADNVTIVPGGLHMNGVVDTAGGGGHAVPYVVEHPADALANIASCRACHGTDYGGGDVGVSCNACHADDATYPALAPGFPDWTTNCTFCHGTRTAGVTTATALAAPPASVEGGDPVPPNTNPDVGAHQAHLAPRTFSNGFACTTCHGVPTPAQALSHFSGQTADATVAFDALASQGVGTPAYTGGSCATYCHGATLEGGPAASPAWTSAAPLTCASCHGNPPASHSAGSTDCNGCHSGTVNSNGTINIAGGLHVNGTVEASSQHPTDWGLPAQHGYYVNANGLASCKACHGASLTGGSAQSCASCHGTGWDTNCTFCHGNPSTGRASPPVDTQGRSVTSNVSVGAHASHVGTTMATPLACGECHPARTTSVITDASHIDGSANGADVAFGALARTGGAAATYTRTSATSATCASTYCHGRFTGGVSSGAGATMSWTSTTAVSCSSCHPSAPSSGEHSRHSGTAGGQTFACVDCHGNSGSGATHVNGTKNVPFSAKAPGAVWNGSSCGTFTCHGVGHGSGDNW